MHWYYYFRGQTGADFSGLTFTTDQLESISVTMRNNADVGNGQIFFNVYTVGTTNGWYENRYDLLIDPDVSVDTPIYTLTLPNGTTSQEVLAIAFGTNSGAPDTLDIDMVAGRFIVSGDTYGWDLELLS